MQDARAEAKLRFGELLGTQLLCGRADSQLAMGAGGSHDGAEGAR